MTPELLESWGRLLLNIARGQQQITELNDWIAQSARGMQEMAGLFGMVPQQEYQKLKAESDALRTQLQERENTIRELQRLLQDRLMAPENALAGFQQLIRLQSDQFLQLARTLQPTPPTSD